MNEQQIKNVVEGALLAVGRPLTLDDLAALFAEDECPQRTTLHAALESLQQDYAERGFELKEVASGFRLQVRAELSPWISRLWIEKPSRYSRALLETMALVAYRQPITRGEIEDIRGVSVSSSIMKTLQEREWVRVVGHRDVPGRPAMYGTTREFLDYFNLKSLDELPTLAELRDIDSINAELDLGFPGGAPPRGADGGEFESGEHDRGLDEAVEEESATDPDAAQSTAEDAVQPWTAQTDASGDEPIDAAHPPAEEPTWEEAESSEMGSDDTTERADDTRAAEAQATANDRGARGPAAEHGERGERGDAVIDRDDAGTGDSEDDDTPSEQRASERN